MSTTLNKTIEILLSAKNDGVDLVLTEGQLQVKVPKDKTVNPNLLDEIRKHKETIIDFLAKEAMKASAQVPAAFRSISKQQREQVPLSYAQERLWFIDQFDGSVQYHLPWVFHITGSLNVAGLEYAFKKIMDRHQVLRTIITNKEGVGYQQVLPFTEWRLTQVPVHDDWGSPTVAQVIKSLIDTPFNLAADPMLRATLLVNDKKEYRLVVVVHHIAFDGWSIGIMINELAVFYNNFIKGSPLTLSQLPVQYTDYAVWQRDFLSGETFAAKLDYWKQHLAGVATLDLLTDYARSSKQNVHGAVVERALPISIKTELLDFSVGQQATSFMVLLAVFNVLLHRYTSQQDICIGTPIAGRDMPEVENLLGFFVNSVALRTQVNAHTSFEETLQQVKSLMIEAFAYKDVPFEQIVEALGVERDLGRNPVFQVMFSMQNEHRSHTPAFSGINFFPEDNFSIFAKVDLHMNIALTDDGLQLSIVYRPDLYRKDSMECMIDHYIQLLQACLRDSNAAIRTLNMIGDAERRRLLEDFNNTTSDFPLDYTVCDWISAHAVNSPGATALKAGDQKIAYAELHDRSTTFARYLQSKGISNGDLVVVCMDRSIDLIVAMLGIMKACAAYVPVDPAYPVSRINYMLRDTKTRLVISAESYRHLFNDAGVDVLCMNEKTIISGEEKDLTKPMSHDLAYVMYTSGSTGTPKGVMISHASVMNLVNWHAQAFEVDEQCRATAMAGIGFDAFGWEVWPYLCRGASVYLLSDEERFSTERTMAIFMEQQITHCFIATALAVNFIRETKDQPLALRYLLTGGDRLPPVPKDTGYYVVNNYGPTENTVVATSYIIDKDDELLSPPIGKPVSNTKAYILDASLQLAAQGVAGELCIGGRQLAAGYLHLPALTAEKFIIDEFGQRLYRTGDKARWLPDGDLEFLGRIDDQVKLRGYRIEPGEVEAVLQQTPGVKQATVLLYEQEDHAGQLAAFIVAAPGWDKTATMAYAKDQLPAYMVPSIWQVLNEIPLTANGKADRKKLLECITLPVNNNAFIPARTKEEAALTAIWTQLLGREKVSVQDNFFESGGHSLLAMRMASAVRKATGKELSVRKIFEYPTIASLATWLSHSSRLATLPPVERYPEETKIPLSFEQERLWFIDRLHGSRQYHIPWVFRLAGRPDSALLNTALKNIVERHTVLRTVFREENGMTCQHLLPASGWQMECHTLESILQDNGSLQQFLERFIQRPFDLSTESPFRVMLLRFSEQEYLLVGVVHHIAFDGWSTGILVRELVDYYRTVRQGGQPVLQPVSLRYADYAIWQRKYLTGQFFEQKIAYWKNQLQGTTPLALITDFPRPAHPTIRGAVVGTKVSRELLDKLVELSHDQGVTLFMTMLAAFKTLLYRHTGVSDICVGTPVAGRRQEELESMIGFFLNTIALRSRVDPRTSFYTLLQQVKQTTLAAYEHQDVPFEKIVEALGSERDRSRNAVFQVWMVLQNMPAAEPLDLVDVQLQAESSGVITSQFDLNLDIAESPEGLQVTLTYCSDLYRRETAMHILDHYTELLRSIVKDATMTIDALQMLPAKELAMIERFSKGSDEQPVHTTITDLFNQQVSDRPSGAALVLEEMQLSYRELNQRANDLAWYLIGQGVQPGDRVGLCIDRGFDMIVGIIGILKAGAAYVPMDPTYPVDRLEYIINDSGCRLVLTTIGTSHPLPPYVPLVYVDTIEIRPNAQVDLPTVSPGDLAYIIYTSGSSGRPKGVLVEHVSVVNEILTQKRTFGIDTNEKILQFSNYCFDASVEQIFLALLSGAALVIIPARLQLDIPAFEEMLSTQAITHLHATPGFLELITPQAYPALKRVVAGGEACAVSLAGKWQGFADFYNEYGPTETTITAIELLANDNPADHDMLPIGRPLPLVQAYLLDDRRETAGIGIPAEIYLGGVQVARGYNNRPELTSEVFIDHPSLGRLYRTGDRGRWLPDGNIAFLGRIDEQVKIRGYRIEPGEVESVLQQAAGIRRVVVLVQEDGTDKRLVAYIVTTDQFDREEIISFAKSRLPEYMVPAALIQVDDIPLTGNGKVDKQKLQEYFVLPSSTQGYEAARNNTEELLVSIWQELLEVEKIGIHDNFFELGGHSLLAVRVIAAIRSRMGKELPVVALFEYPTIALLSTQITVAEKEELLPSITRFEGKGKIPLSFSQERLWFIDRLQGSIQYHMPWVFRLKGELDTVILEDAFKEIISRHEVLRTIIRDDEGIPHQLVTPVNAWQMQCTNEEEITSNGTTVQTYIDRLLQQPYDLAADPMLKATLIRMAGNEHLLVILLHHIAFDGWSISVIAKELSKLYNSRLAGTSPLLNELPVQYKDYAAWQRNYLSGKTLENKLAFWKNKLAGIVPLDLPTDYPRPAVQSTRGRTRSFIINKELLDGLNALSRQHGATLFMTMSAVFKILLQRYTDQADIAIGTPVANRTQDTTDALVGFFVNTVVLRDDLGDDPSFETLLQQVKTTALEAYAHQDTPFEKIVEAVTEERNMSYTPLFQVLFALQNVPEVPDLRLSGINLEQEPVVNTTARFDLYVDLTETPAGLQVLIEYCTDLFHPDTITRLFGHYTGLLRSVVADPSQRIGSLDMISKCELLLLQQFNETTTEFPSEKTICGMFEQQVALQPDAIAMAYGDAVMSYRELNERSNRLAHFLMSNKIGEGQLVMVCMERSFDMITAVLAILKAGAAYVPIDPRYPRERIDFMLQDADAACIITSSACSGVANEGPGRIRIRMDGDWDMISRYGDQNPGVNVSPGSLCYVIYTSGSTGRPKGVELTRDGLTNLLLWQEGQSRDRQLRILQFASLNFDVSFQEIFTALCFGNSLHLIDEDRRKDMRELMTDIICQEITSLFIPYVVVKSLAAYAADTGIYPTTLREIFTAGEQLKLTEDIRLFTEKTGSRLLNQYGPSEAHVVSSYEVQPSDYITRILPPIGRPVANTQLYVLGKNGRQTGIGIIGELYIGGVQVARGYCNRPELTAEKFTADHITGKDGAMLYATGDKVRWLADGTIEFLGRLDDQVKIHGYRIELGEVEAALQKAPGIRQAVVVVKQDADGTKRLVGFVVPAGTFDNDALQKYLRQHLPVYMIPAFVLALDAIPLTSNGKVDKKRLPGVDVTKLSRRYEAPRTVTEEKIVAIWEQLLGIQPVSVYDNFFEIGGHSLLVTRVAAIIRKEFEMEISVPTFFQLATPEALAAYIDVNQVHASYDPDNYEAIEL